MNVMFWILLVILCTVLWFLLAFLFRPIGNVFYKIWKDAFDILTDNDKTEEKKDGE